MTKMTISGMTNDSNHAYMPEYWKRFPPIDYRIHFCIGIFVSVLGIVALFANISVITACLSPRWRHYRKAMMVYVMNLAFADCIICVLGFPMLAISSFYGTWAFNKIGCDIYAFCNGVGGIASINIMAVISRERYNAISRHMVPFQPRCDGTLKQSLLTTLVVWIFSTMMLAPPLLGWSRYVVDGHGTSCTTDYITQTTSNRYFYLFLFICGFSIPLCATIFYYTSLLLHVRSHNRQFQGQGQGQGRSLWRLSSSQRMWQRRELRLSRSCAIVVLTFVLAWAPYATISMLSVFGIQHHLSPMMTLIPGLFAKLCVIHNPIIYSLTHPRFKTALTSMLKGMFACEKG